MNSTSTRGAAPREKPAIIVVMGVSGAGKTTIGRRLAAALGCGFSDADEFHGAANIAKMKSGVALTDADRESWLRAIRGAIERRRSEGTMHVFTCSALKASYRRILAGDDSDVTFVHLRGDPDLIRSRLERRKHHFFDPALLPSQFAALEEPEGALVFDVRETPKRIVERILAALQR